MKCNGSMPSRRTQSASAMWRHGTRRWPPTCVPSIPIIISLPAAVPNRSVRACSIPWTTCNRTPTQRTSSRLSAVTNSRVSRDSLASLARPGPPAGYNKLVRDGIYGGILAGHAGAGMYWFWDRVDRAGLGPSFLAAREVIDRSGLLTHPNAKPWALSVETPRTTEMQVAAGGGWSQSTLSELDLPGVDVRKLGGWSQYFQSLDGGNKAWAKPFLVKFNAKKSGTMLIQIGQVSPNGAALTVWVNDKQVLDQKFDPPAANSRPAFGRVRAPLAIQYPSGPVVVRIENHGKDWVRMDAISVPDIGPTAGTHGMGDRNWALVRVFGSDTSSVKIAGLGLRDGTYKAEVFDAANGQTAPRSLEVHSGAFETTDLPSDCSFLAIGK